MMAPNPWDQGWLGSSFTQRPDDQAFSDASMYLVANMLPNAAAIITDMATKAFDTVRPRKGEIGELALTTVPPARLTANLSRPPVMSKPLEGCSEYASGLMLFAAETTASAVAASPKNPIMAERTDGPADGAATRRRPAGRVAGSSGAAGSTPAT